MIWQGQLEPSTNKADSPIAIDTQLIEASPQAGHDAPPTTTVRAHDARPTESTRTEFGQPTPSEPAIALVADAATSASVGQQPAAAGPGAEPFQGALDGPTPPPTLGKVNLRDPGTRAAMVAKIRKAEDAEAAAVAAKAKRLGIPLELVENGQKKGRLVGFDGDTPRYEVDYNVNAAISSGANRVRSTAPYGVTGSGLSFGLWEAGGTPLISHQEFGAPTKIAILDGDTTPTDHATHVAGTLAGLGTNPLALGMAPGAQILAYNSSNDNSEMLAVGATFPGEPSTVYVSNHSYGLRRGWDGSTWYGTFIDDGDPSNDVDERNGRYDSSAAAMDDMLYNLPYFLPFMSSGNDRNDGPPSAGSTWYIGSTPRTYDPNQHPAGDGQYKDGYDVLDPEKTAKNVITIGAAEDAVAAGLRNVPVGVLTTFSSTGPTDDGRIKPDVVANGANLTSSIGTGVSDYGVYSGTSMSSPNAAGSALLLIDYYRTRFPGQAMRAATLKALIIHTADDTGTPGPDYQYGWGYMNTEKAAAHIKQQADGGSNPVMIEADLTTADGDDSYTFRWNGNEPIRVTLVWNDPASSGTAVHDDRTRKLVNDLNLTITGPGGSTHLPFVMPYVGNWTNAMLGAAATTGVNNVDNVEQVLVAAPPQAGLYTITVDHADTLGYDIQEYSLMISGGGVPDMLAITPFDGLNASGDAGGPFSPTSKTFTLTNESGNSMDWTASVDVPWANLSAASGTITTGAATSLGVSLTTAADALPIGVHQGTVTITNVTAGTTQTRQVVVQAIGHPEIAIEEPEGSNLTSGAATIDFASAPVGAQLLKRLAIRNTGNVPLVLGAPKLASGDTDSFRLAALSVANVPPGGTAYLDVTFAPLSAGSKSASLELSSNDEDEPVFQITLNGSGDLFGGGVQLTRTINNTLAGIGSTTLVSMDTYVTFAATTTGTGRELWRSDGTAAGTYMVKDINAGSISSSPGNLTRVGNKLFFAATTSANGTELWSSDGTAAGTVLVKDIQSGLLSSSPTSMVDWNGTLYFGANDGTNGTELWKSDGTNGGTVIVANISAGSASSLPGALTPAGSVMYFTASTSTTGAELWKTDGTAAGTVLVKDINPGTTSGSISNLKMIGSTLYFAANDGTNGTELWKSDGTAAGTVMVKDVNPGSVSSSPLGLVELGGLLYFRGTTATQGSELWRSDGTEAGTVLVKEILAGTSSGMTSSPFVFGGYLWFSGSDGISGNELWRSDGTEAGTTLFADLYFGTSSSSPSFFTQSGTGFAFSAFTATGRELWWSDGTPGGTLQMKDILPGSSSGNPSNLVDMGGTLMFVANDGLIGTELWRSNGTSVGTVPVADTITGANSTTLANLTEVNGKLYFGANDAITGTELWTSDGTIPGTYQVKDIYTGPSSSTPSGITKLGSGFVFAANGGTSLGNELWGSDGTTNGTVLIKDMIAGSTSSNPSARVSIGANAFFLGTDGTTGIELWKTDGTSAGTVLVKDIFTGTSNSSLNSLVALNGKVVMSANNGTNGAEPWVSDGTSAGTVLLSDVYAGSSSSSPSIAAGGVMDGKLYFSAANLSNGRELWVTDGTPGGTSMLADIFTGISSSSPNGFTAQGGYMYFSAISSGIGIELWRTDGTTPQLVKDINSGANSSSPNSITVLGNILVFAAADSANGNELWRSDGTAAGTYLIKDIYPGTGGSSPTLLTNVNGTVFFRANHPTYGSELWKTDGTAAGTELVADLMPGTDSSNPLSLTRVGPKLFFIATIPNFGSQLMTVDNSFPAEIAIEQPVGNDLVSGVSTVDFGTVDVGQTQTLSFTIRNVGDLPLLLGTPQITGATALFHVTNPSATEVPGQSSITISVTFDPTRNGPQSAVLTIPSNDSDEPAFAINLTGTGANQPSVGLDSPPGSPLAHAVSTVSFGSVNLGASSAAQTVAVKSLNLGSQLMVTRASVTGANAGDFNLNVTSLASVIAGGASSSFTVAFTPLGSGSRTATLSVESNDPDVPAFQVTLTGNGSALAGPGQTIFGPAVLSPRFATDGAFVLPYVASSGLPLTVEVLAGAGVVSSSGTTLTPTGTGGAVTMRLSQSGGSGYDAAPEIVRTLLVAVGRFADLARGSSSFHSAAILEDGSLWTWGRNSNGQLGVGNLISSDQMQRVGIDTDWRSVSVGNLFTLATKKNGTLWAWGNNSFGQLGTGSASSATTPIQVGTASDWGAIAAGGLHVLALKTDGSLWTWGYNVYAQLGHGDTSQRTSPTRVGLATDWKRIAAGYFHSAALKQDNTLWTWGYSNYGQLGQGDTNNKTTPTQVGSASSWNKIACGYFGTFAIRNDGTLWGVGYNTSYQIGMGSSANQSSFVQVGSATDWTDVIPGYYNTAGLRAGGTLWTWGTASEVGRTAQGNSGLRPTPTRLGTDSGWTNASVGTEHMLMLKNDGTIWNAGGNEYGQLGYPSPNPTRMASGGIRAIGQGVVHTHFIKQDGTLWGVGSTQAYLGDGLIADRAQPIQIGTATNWDAISCGYKHSLGLRDGELWACGYNFYGQVGNGNTSPQQVFIQIGTDSTWEKVAAGYFHSAAIKQDGSLWIWGSNGNGELGQGDAASRNTPTRVGTDTDWVAVTAGYGHTLALKADGTLWSWGQNSSGQLGQGGTTASSLPAQVGTDSDWSQISAGYFNSHAVKRDGTLWGWGYNFNGNVGDGSTAQRVSPVQIGSDNDWASVHGLQFHSVAHKTNGELWSWGRNLANEGGSGLIGAQLSPVRISNLTAWTVLPSGTGQFTVAATADGTLWGFGVNGDSQLTDSVRRSSVLAYTSPGIGRQTVTVPALEVTEFNTPITIQGTATSGLPVSYAVSGPASLVGNQLTVTGPGPVKLLAWQNGEQPVWHTAAPIQVDVLTKPTATTLAATLVDVHTATLNATAFAGAQATTVSFEYDTDISDTTYAYTATATPGSIDGTDEWPVAAALTGLAPGTTYHFRAKVINATGTSYSDDLTFTTLTPDLAAFDGTLAGTELQDGTGTVDFGTIVTGDSVTRTFTLANTGTGALTISNVTVTTGWTLDLTGMATTIAAGASTSFTASLAPATVGALTGSITITSDDPDEAAFDIALAGYGKLPQAITFASIDEQSCGTPLSLSATASSGLPVSYTLTAGADIASLNAGTITFTGTGTVTLEATQLGNATYTAAAPVSRSFTVIKGNQVISFDSGLPTSTSYRATVNLSAVSDRGLTPVTFSVTSGPGALVGSTLSFSAPGPVQIQAAQAGDACFNPATALFTLTATNTAPVVTADSGSGDEDQPITGSLSGTDVDPGTTLTYTKVTDPTNGSVTVNPNGSYTYQPAADFNGSDSFTFKANDGLTDSNIATITLTIAAVNDAPVASNASNSGDEDTAITGSLSATDTEMDSLTFSKVVDPAHGTVTVNPNGTYTYQPAPDYNGTDSFTFKTNDGFADSNIATISLSIAAVNDAPIASNGSLTTDEDTFASGSLVGTDVDLDSLTFSKVSDPAKGTVIVNPDGTYTFTPIADANGSDSFTFVVTDGALNSNTATVTITINPVNDVPAAADSSTTGQENDLVVGALSGTDTEASPLTFHVFADPTSGTLELAEDGTFRYQPDAGFVGIDGFTFIVNDGTTDSAEAHVTIVINSALPRWTWLAGPTLVNQKSTLSDPQNPGARQDAATWSSPDGRFWLFGGTGYGDGAKAGALNDLWEYDVSIDDWSQTTGSTSPEAPGIYGTPDVADPANTPGARSGAASWMDADGNLWIFGGLGRDSAGATGLLNDLWKFDPIESEWTWVRGSNLVNRNGAYTAIGTPSVANAPGARSGATVWTDPCGAIWLFGGRGLGAAGTTAGELSDLWKYDPATSIWTWIGGSSAVNATGTYGTKNIATSGAQPGSRSAAIGWTGHDGSLWLFGGQGRAVATAAGKLNDLWKYVPSANQWIWISGTNATQSAGSYGVLGVEDPGNQPAARDGAAGWMDGKGDLWIFGGQGRSGVLSDVWRYSLTTGNWTWMKGQQAPNDPAIYGTKAEPNSTNTPSARRSSAAFVDIYLGQLWIFGGGSGTRYSSDLWRLDVPPAPVAITASATLDSEIWLNGLVSPNDLPTTAFFRYGTRQDLVGAQETPVDFVGILRGSYDFQAEISGLSADTTYYYQIVASNAQGQSSGAVRCFSTGSAPVTAKLAFATGDQTISESAGSTTITLTLDAPLPSVVNIPFTLSGTAQQGQDYFPPNSPLTFVAGQTSATVIIPILSDVLEDGTKTLTLTLGTLPASVMLEAAESATVTIEDDDTAPTITLHPQSVISPTGTTIQLTVAATGSGDLRYQWSKNGRPIRGATTPTLAITGTLTAIGNYSAEVRNNTGVATSDAAEVSIVDSASKTVILLPNGTTTLTATARSPGSLAYQWMMSDGTPGALGSPIPAATSPTLKLAAVTDINSGAYWCVISRPATSIPDGSSGITTVAVVSQAPELESFTLPVGVVGGDYTATVPFNPDPARTPRIFTAKGLPPRMKLDPATGAISGRPSSAVTDRTVTFTASNNAGKSAPVTAVLTILALPTANTGTYLARVERQNAVNQDAGQRLDLTTTSNGGFSGKLSIATTTLSFKGLLDVQLDNTGSTPVISAGARILLTPKGANPLVLIFDLDADGDRITGRVEDATATHSTALLGYRNIWKTTGPKASDYKGYYTLGTDLPPSLVGDLQVPQGNGFASFTIADAGTTRIAFKLPDGQSAIVPTFVGPQGQLVIFSAVGKNLGTLLGIPTIVPDAINNSLGGTLSWNKLPAAAKSTDRLYRAGFFPIDLSIAGGKYIAPGSGEVLMNLPNTDSNATLRFHGAGLLAGQADPLTFSIRNNRPTGQVQTIVLPKAGSPENPDKISLKLSPTTGLFSGAFTLTHTDRTLTRTSPYQGAIVQTGSIYQAMGFFLLPQLPEPGQTLKTADQLSGQVLIEPLGE